MHSGGLVNDAMIQHLPTHARMMEDNTTIARMALVGQEARRVRDRTNRSRNLTGAHPLNTTRRTDEAPPNVRCVLR